MIRLTGVREMEAKLMAVANSREVRSAMAAEGAKVLASMATDAIRDAKLRPVSSGETFGVASDRPYAVFHQYGTKKMPARPFIPAPGDPGAEKLTPVAEKAVAEAAQAAFDAALGKVTG